jgi:restriction endonuclease S subunit
MMDVCYKYNLAVIIVCVNLRPKAIITSFRFKVIVKNNLLPQMYTGYLLHFTIALAAFVKGSGRHERIITTVMI